VTGKMAASTVPFESNRHSFVPVVMYLTMHGHFIIDQHFTTISYFVWALSLVKNHATHKRKGGSLHLTNMRQRVQYDYERVCAISLWGSPLLRETILLQAAPIEFRPPPKSCSDRVSSPFQIRQNTTLARTAQCIHATYLFTPKDKARYLQSVGMWHLPTICFPKEISDVCYQKLVTFYQGKVESKTST